MMTSLFKRTILLYHGMKIMILHQTKHKTHHSVSNLQNEFDSYKKGIKLEAPSLNLNYLLNKQNREQIENNMNQRKTHVDLNELYELNEAYEQSKDPAISEQITQKALLVPNTSHAAAPTNKDFEIVKTINEKKSFNFKPKSFTSLMNKHGLCRTDEISHYLGNRSYYFTGDLCLLENAIVQFVMDKLIEMNFQLITVSDILSEDVIRRCGMNTRGERSQIYHLDPTYYGEGWCLSGTAEMGIAKNLINRTIPLNELPMKLAAMSKCYRAEISDTADEKGVYRVHCFTKIEMFGVTKPQDSEKCLAEFLQFEEDLFSGFGLPIRVLNMGTHELGAQAHRKYDIEAWMPGKKGWGELSSCSDCTDYQARRLNVKSSDGNFVHTLNGTACAIPRLLMAIVETHQNKDGTVNVPQCLQPYVGKDIIGDRRGAPALVKVKTGLSKTKKKELAKAAVQEKS